MSNSVLVKWLQHMHTAVEESAKSSSTSTPLRKHILSSCAQLTSRYHSFSTKYLEDTKYLLLLLNIIEQNEFKTICNDEDGKGSILSQIKDFFSKRGIVNKNYFQNLWDNFDKVDTKWKIIEVCFIVWVVCHLIEPSSANKSVTKPLDMYNPLINITKDLEADGTTVFSLINLASTFIRKIEHAEVKPLKINHSKDKENAFNQLNVSIAQLPAKDKSLESRLNSVYKSISLSTDTKCKELKGVIEELSEEKQNLKESNKQLSNDILVLTDKLTMKSNELEKCTSLLNDIKTQEIYVQIQDLELKNSELEKVNYSLNSEKTALCEKLEKLQQSLAYYRKCNSVSSSESKQAKQIDLFVVTTANKSTRISDTVSPMSPLLETPKENKNQLTSFKFENEGIYKESFEPTRPSKELQSDMKGEDIDKLEEKCYRLSEALNESIATILMEKKISKIKDDKAKKMKHEHYWNEITHCAISMIGGALVGVVFAWLIK